MIVVSSKSPPQKNINFIVAVRCIHTMCILDKTSTCDHCGHVFKGGSIPYGKKQRVCPSCADTLCAVTSSCTICGNRRTGFYYRSCLDGSHVCPLCFHHAVRTCTVCNRLDSLHSLNFLFPATFYCSDCSKFAIRQPRPVSAKIKHSS